MLNCYVKTDSVLAEVRMPSTVAGFHQARKERLERIKLAAFSILEVGAAPAVVPAPEPEPVDSWAERQKRIPMPKPRWFAVVEDLGPIVPRAPHIEEIIQACSQYFAISKTEMIANRRTAGPAYARHIVMYLAKTLTQRSLPEIGRMLGKRDHTTILHGVRKITGLVHTDWTVAYDVAHVEALL